MSRTMNQIIADNTIEDHNLVTDCFDMSQCYGFDSTQDNYRHIAGDFKLVDMEIRIERISDEIDELISKLDYCLVVKYYTRNIEYKLN